MVSRLVGWSAILAGAAAGICGGGRAARAGTFADMVVEYAPGAISSPSLQQSGAAATGLPASVDDGQTSPFSPPFHASSITVVGAGGHITLHFAAPVFTGDGRDIGVFTNTGLVATTVNGVVVSKATAGGTAAVFSSDAAIVSVSADGESWVALNGGNALDLTMPSNAFVDGTLSASGGTRVSGGVTPADPYLPFDGTLSDFAGLSYPEMVSLLHGSFGGAWIDASGSGLAAINYIRFDVPTGDRLVLDAVTARSEAPEPGTLAAAVAGLAWLGARRRRR
jgi:hypothetical protein